MAGRVSLRTLVGAVVCAVVMVVTIVTANDNDSSGNNDFNNMVPAVQVSGVTDFPFGDPRFCLQIARKEGYKLKRFEVLPGYGWDNLRNVAQGQVVSFNYSKCRTTEDGRFLLPDSVSAVPVKTSRMHVFADLMSSWQDWTSTTAKSINQNAGLRVYFVTVSGKFSADFEDLKSKQINDKSVTTRTQLRYIRYEVQLQPDTPLHPVFKHRVLGIAAAEELGDKERARYLAQLLVRDFGTHITTEASAGAALLQVDQLQEQWVKKNMKFKNDILATATLILFTNLEINLNKFESRTSKTFTEEYLHARTSSKVMTLGGPIFRPGNFTPDRWAADVDRDLVAMDRSGDPIYYVLTEATLPEVPTSTLNEVYKAVKEAVDAYYAHNRIPGCLDPTSPNYNPSANTDDGTCKPAPTNLTFGGVFQTCSMKHGSNNGDLCGKLNQMNPLTGGYSCPTNYQAIKLHSGNTSSSSNKHVCESFLVFWQKCHDDYYYSQATYDMYWCVDTGDVPQDSGYLFGGLYTSRVANPVTRAATCPPAFFPLKFGAAADLHVCISDDYEFGNEYHLPFAGFISCEAGNPLAVAGNGSSGQDQDNAHGSLKMFFKDHVKDWPKRCPVGFSRHLASVDQGCEIDYCVRTGAMKGPVLPPIKRPPFMPAPALPAPPTENVVIFDPETHTWKRNKQAAPDLSQKILDIQVSPETADAGIFIAPLVVISVIVMVGLIAVVVRCRRDKCEIAEDHSSPRDSREGYGSVGSVDRRPASSVVNVATAESTPLMIKHRV